MRTRAEIETEFAPRESLDGFREFFLVGIGGAGMSGIAMMLRHRGFSVAGTDSTDSSVVAGLRSAGIDVHIGHSGEYLKTGDALVLSDAIDLKTSPEVQRARELGVPLFRRSQVLGWLLRDKKCICVTGTHGKTTTTGMIGAGLLAAGMDPTIVIGANVPEFGGAIVEGQGEWAVVEACEAYDSLRDLDPFIVVLTNLELDHVDFHGDWECLRTSVARFVNRIPKNRGRWSPNEGALVYCSSDEGSKGIGDEFYELSDGPTFSYNVDEFAVHAGLEMGREVPKISLPGAHNLLNASAAVCTLACLSDALPAAIAGIADFRGAERRFQILHDELVTVIDDYAHHPTEVAATITALRDGYPNRRLIVVFQPHLYTRTADLIPEFAEALSLADHVVLTDIYQAREALIPGVSSARIAELVTKPMDYVASRHLLPRFVASMVKGGDVVVGMGAGDISEFAPALIKELERAKDGKKRIAVIYGGDSAEREVSIHSGLAVLVALNSKGYEATMVDVSELLLSTGDLSRFTGLNRPDAAFLAVHGTNAEDGAIQGLLELLHIPYTGSGIQSSALAMDKHLSKQILKTAGLRVPEGTLIRADTTEASKFVKLVKPPAIVKPNAQGSTVGLSFVRKRSEIAQALAKALGYGGEALVEEWIEGMEISVSVLGDRALPVVEIVPRSGEYDFASKYLPGATEEIIPARLPDDVLKRAQEAALVAHRALHCRGATRTDMIVRGEEIIVLEINTVPGMTPTSLLPNSAKAAGIEFPELCEWMVEEALSRREKAN